jgi:predicted transcriptional regulator
MLIIKAKDKISNMTGYEIKDRRINIDLSQSKLAAITGIEQARILAYELGKLELTTSELKKISFELNRIDEKTVLKLTR